MASVVPAPAVASSPITSYAAALSKPVESGAAPSPAGSSPAASPPRPGRSAIDVARAAAPSSPSVRMESHAAGTLANGMSPPGAGAGAGAAGAAAAMTSVPAGAGSSADSSTVATAPSETPASPASSPGKARLGRRKNARGNRSSNAGKEKKSDAPKGSTKQGVSLVDISGRGAGRSRGTETQASTATAANTSASISTSTGISASSGSSSSTSTASNTTANSNSNSNSNSSGNTRGHPTSPGTKSDSREHGRGKAKSRSGGKGRGKGAATGSFGATHGTQHGAPSSNSRGGRPIPLAGPATAGPGPFMAMSPPQSPGPSSPELIRLVPGIPTSPVPTKDRRGSKAHARRSHTATTTMSGARNSGGANASLQAPAYPIHAMTPSVTPIGFPPAAMLSSPMYFPYMRYPMGYYGAPHYMPRPAMSALTPRDMLLRSIAQQIEFYFSVENLVKDTYLRERLDHEGYIACSILMTFHRVRRMCPDVATMIEATSHSPVVEVDYVNEKIRPRVNWQQWLFPNPDGTRGVPLYQKSAPSKGAIPATGSPSGDGPATVASHPHVDPSPLRLDARPAAEGPQAGLPAGKPVASA